LAENDWSWPLRASKTAERLLGKRCSSPHKPRWIAALAECDVFLFTRGAHITSAGHITHGAHITFRAAEHIMQKSAFCRLTKDAFFVGGERRSGFFVMFALAGK